MTKQELEQTIYYLESIMRLLQQDAENVTWGPSLYTEVLYDDIDWLENYIDKLRNKKDE